MFTAATRCASFMFYSSGVYTTKDCANTYDDLNHCMGIVGYDNNITLNKDGASATQRGWLVSKFTDAWLSFAGYLCLNTHSVPRFCVECVAGNSWGMHNTPQMSLWTMVD